MCRTRPSGPLPRAPWVYEGRGAGFSDTASEWTLPSGYGTPMQMPFALLASTYADCATNDPYHSTLDVTGDGWQDLVVTLAPCGDQGVGRDLWWVYEASCDL